MFGKWNEALYVGGKAPSGRCIWRAGSEEAEPYYGVSRFAVELNEVTSVERSRIPLTDARLRPEQKAIEEGRGEEVENTKLKVEDAHIDRRRQRENDHICISWFGRLRISINSSWSLITHNSGLSALRWRQMRERRWR